MHSDSSKFRHDLRNLVNSFRLAMAAMDLEKNPIDKADWLTAIERNAERGVDILDEYTPFQDASQSPAPKTSGQ